MSQVTMNVHGVTEVRAAHNESEGTEWVTLSLISREGSELELTLFSADCHLLRSIADRLAPVGVEE